MELYAVLRHDQEDTFIVHIGSSLEASKEWCDRRLLQSNAAGLQDDFQYPDEIVWEGGIAQIGRRGSLQIQKWELDGDIFEVGEIIG